MGFYLGQLPPAEIARFKAELAETLITNFCYPRFFDHRTSSLQMRPVDRTKRQEVWLYLSSVDFTAWSRVDLTSADFQHQIERLFIGFVQRNRSFFGEQGRRRMSDIRMLIGTNAGSVAQRVRTHLSGQKQSDPPFGSPRPVVSWTASNLSKRPEPGWEQISAATLVLQQQLQELRGEARATSPAVSDGRSPVQAARGSTDGRSTAASSAGTRPTTASEGRLTAANGAGTRPAAPVGYVAPIVTNGTSRRITRPQPAAPGNGANGNGIEAPVMPSPILPPTTQASPRPTSPASSGANGKDTAVSGQKQTTAPTPVSPQVPPRPSELSVNSVEQTVSVRKFDPPVPAVEPLVTTAAPMTNVSAPGNGVAEARPAESKVRTSPLPEAVSAAAIAPGGSAVQSRVVAQATNVVAPTQGTRDVLSVGEDDIAIFEQMRHQLMIWLRVEAVSAGLEVANQGPSQLLEMLRQQAHFDETRLQVVSTLLNLANQVIKTGLVSVLDYKQALMFHLMHTRRV